MKLSSTHPHFVPNMLTWFCGKQVRCFEEKVLDAEANGQSLMSYVWRLKSQAHTDLKGLVRFQIKISW